MTHIFRLLTFLCILLVSELSLATCYKVTRVGTAGTTSNNEIRPGEGVASNWPGACDTCNGPLGLPTVVNVSDSSFQPYPTLLASAVAPFTQFGATAGYNPEQVLFRCAPADAVYEMFSTNGDDQFSGYYSGGDRMGMEIGLTAAYRTAWPNVLLRLTHMASGEYITHIWKEHLLTKLDKDSRGFHLIKVKNLSAVRSELYSAPLESGVSFPYSATTKSQMYLRTQPEGYVAIKGPGLAYPKVGQAHAGGNWAGLPANWPGTIGLYKDVTLKRYPTCAVLTVTPYVLFPSISHMEINRGDSVTAPFEVRIKCQPGAINSTAPGGTAIGVLVSPGSLAVSNQLKLANSSGGLAYLVSENYGSSGIAQGVGIRILRGSSAINLLANENSAGGSDAENVGWYPHIGKETQYVGSVDGSSVFNEVFHARLEKFQVGTQPAVTAGKVRATAQVVIRVQ